MSRPLALAAVVIAAIAAASLAGCADAPVRAVPEAAALASPEAEAYRDAAAALDAGDAEMALRAIESAAEREPWHVPSHVLRQDALVALGREAEARTWYGDEAERHPDDASRALMAARLAPRAGGAREVAYRAALKLDPTSVWTRIALAYELARTAHDDQARATSLADAGFRSDSTAAREHAAASRAEAEALAAAVAAERPDLAAAQGVFADVLFAGGLKARDPRAPDALRAAEASAAIDPGSAEAWGRVGRLRRALADDANAAVAFRRAADIAPGDATLQASLGRVLLDLRRDSAARDVLGEASRLAPADAAVAENHGVALFRTGRYDAAAKEFARASKLAPSDPSPLEGMALALAEAGDRDAAADAMEAYLAAGGNDRDAARRFIEQMQTPENR